MARYFDQASTEYFEVNATPISAAPLTVAAWFYSPTASVSKTLFYTGDKDATDHWMVLYLDSANKVTCGARAGADNSGIAVTTPAHSNNVWQHAAGVWTSDSSRAAFLNGGDKATNSVSKTPAGLDRLSIGRHGDSTPGTYMEGRIAEMGIWAVALSDGEIALLARGVCPLRIRPQSLVGYYPLYGNGSPEPNLAVGGGTYNLTMNGTISQVDHAPVMAPFAFDQARPYVVAGAPPGGGGGDGLLWWAGYGNAA